jgi:uncharacterized protein (TIGR02147 family)
MSNLTSLDVFSFLDYRKFLAEYYRRKKKATATFSFRAFARRAGLRSPNHLKRVIDRERNLSAETAIVYAETIGLEGDAAAYFCELVRFDQAKSSKERSNAYRRLTQYRGYQRAQGLDAQHDRYHSEWYIPAVREMVSLPDFRADPRWIADQLVPPITEKQAADALTVLEELGMLVRKGDAMRRADPVVSTGPETSGLHVVHFHGVMMEKAIQSIDTVPAADRDISGVTLCIPEGALAELKERIRDFRKEVIAREAEEGAADRVVHVAIQLFPLTKGRLPRGRSE